MFKNKKGFTLIELLAVIVILAIIALIATPQILGVIETARVGSAESSALGYVDAVEKQVLLNDVDSKATATQRFNLNAVYSYTKAQLDSKGVTVKGKAPSSGTVIIGTDGQVVEATLQFGDYNVYYDYDAATQATATKTTDAHALTTSATAAS